MTTARPAQRAVVAAVALAVTLLPLNSTMLAVALPDIASDTGGGLAATSWLVTVYVVALAGLSPFAGRLGDRLGRRRVVLAGLASFASASVLAAAAPSFAVLLVARLIQAASGAMVVPNGMAIVRTALPDGRRAAGFGAVGSALGIAAATGPALGGLITSAFGWRAIFLVNLPVAALAFALVVWAVAADSAADRASHAARSHGALRRVLRRPGFAAPTAATGLSNLAMYSTLLALPVVLHHRDGWSTADAGLALALMSAVMVTVSPAAGRFADRNGHRAPALAGLALLAVAMAGLAAMGSVPPVVGVLVAMVTAGAGLGLANAPLQTSAVEAVDGCDAGVASGLYSTGRYLGSVGAAALLAVVLGDGGHAAALFGIAGGAAVAAFAFALAISPRAEPSVASGRPGSPAASPAPSPAR